MTTRNYGQACSVANFQDRLGSRWTLLIIRDLLIGPRRFKELLEGLPGIGTNLLTNRLKELKDLEIIEKTQDEATGSSVYVLTRKGQGLEPVIVSMARWGMEHLQADYAGKISRPDLLVVAFRAAFEPENARDLHETYEFRVGETIFYAQIEDGLLKTGLGTARQPVFIYIADSNTFDAIVSGSLDESEARKNGTLEVIGDKDAYQRFLSIFSNRV
jgi:DNA-binding HxlR family transcriptional regulator